MLKVPGYQRASRRRRYLQKHEIGLVRNSRKVPSEGIHRLLKLKNRQNRIHTVRIKPELSATKHLLILHKDPIIIPKNQLLMNDKIPYPPRGTIWIDQCGNQYIGVENGSFARVLHYLSLRSFRISSSTSSMDRPDKPSAAADLLN